MAVNLSFMRVPMSHGRDTKARGVLIGPIWPSVKATVNTNPIKRKPVGKWLLERTKGLNAELELPSREDRVVVDFSEV